MINMHLKDKPFQNIKSGRKNIEIRLYDEKRQQLKIGDIIKFTHNETGEEILAKIVKLHIFKNFDELYKHFNKEQLGYDSNEIALSSDMSEYYPEIEQQKYGVVGIEIKII